MKPIIFIRNCTFKQNFHTRILDKITVFYTVPIRLGKLEIKSAQLTYYL